jgi:hypothetical protein
MKYWLSAFWTNKVRSSQQRDFQTSRIVKDQNEKNSRSIQKTNFNSFYSITDNILLLEERLQNYAMGEGMQLNIACYLWSQFALCRWHLVIKNSTYWVYSSVIWLLPWTVITELVEFRSLCAYNRTWSGAVFLMQHLLSIIKFSPRISLTLLHPNSMPAE